MKIKESPKREGSKSSPQVKCETKVAHSPLGCWKTCMILLEVQKQAEQIYGERCQNTGLFLEMVLIRRGKGGVSGVVITCIL